MLKLLAFVLLQARNGHVNGKKSVSSTLSSSTSLVVKDETSSSSTSSVSPSLFFRPRLRKRQKEAEARQRRIERICWEINTRLCRSVSFNLEANVYHEPELELCSQEIKALWYSKEELRMLQP